MNNIALPRNPFEDNLNEAQKPINFSSEEYRKLNLSPTKPAGGMLSVQQRVDNMTLTQLQKGTNQMIGQAILENTIGNSLIQMKGPNRLSNRNFMEEFHKIYHGQDEIEIKGLRKSVNHLQGSQSKTGHGSMPIDFNLYEEVIQERVYEATQEALKKSSNEIHKKINEKTKNIKDYVDLQVQRNSFALQNLQEDIKLQERQQPRDYMKSHESNKMLTNQSMQLGSRPQQFVGGGVADSQSFQQHINVSSNDDFKTKAIKKSLMEDIKMSLMANKLDCKPIEGHNIPLSLVERAQIRNAFNGDGAAQLIEVQNIERADNEMKSEEEILSMLIPNQLKRATMDFIEVEDLKTIKVAPNAPKTQDQIDRENYEEVLERDRNEVLVTDEQRQKTIKCLLKVLDYQLKSVKEQAEDIDGHYKKVDKDIKELEDIFKKEENRVTMENVKFKIKQAEEVRREYNETADGDVRYDIENIIVENKLLIDKVNDLLGHEDSVLDEDAQSEMDSLSSSIIDSLYKQVTKGKKKPQQYTGMSKPQRLVQTKVGAKTKKQVLHSPVKLDSRLLEVKENKKKEIKERFVQKQNTQQSPAKREKSREKSRGKSLNKKIDKQINKEIASAMHGMTRLMDSAFKDKF